MLDKVHGMKKNIETGKNLHQSFLHDDFQTNIPYYHGKLLRDNSEPICTR